MAKKNIPAQKVTHTEILCLAISQLNSQIDTLRQKMEGLPENHPMTQWLLDTIAPLEEKKEIIKQLYKIETGVEYN